MRHSIASTGALLLSAAFVVVVAAVARADVELVVVAETIDVDEGIIVRENGSAYRILKDTGCLAFSSYEGRRVLISSPRGGFLGEGAEIILLEKGQRCEITSYQPLGIYEGRPLEIATRVARLSRQEIRMLAQAALQVLDYYPFEVDGEPSQETDDAIRAFQKAHRIEATGKIGPVTMLAMGGRVERAYAEDPGKQAIGMLLRREAVDELDCYEGYTIGAPVEGLRIVLEDDTVWRIRDGDRDVIAGWVEGDKLMICRGVMMNLGTGDVVGIEEREE